MHLYRKCDYLPISRLSPIRGFFSYTRFSGMYHACAILLDFLCKLQAAYKLLKTVKSYVNIYPSLRQLDT